MLSKLNESVSLSELQLALMRVLWEHGSATTADVVQAMRGERELAHTTVATLLSRLERRGLVMAERDGRQLTYTPLITEADVRQSMVSGLLTNLFEGKASALLSHLLKREEIDVEDLDRIRDLLKRRGAKHD